MGSEMCIRDSFYIEGRSGKTDRFVKWFLMKKGWFKGPFETQTSLQLRLSQDYQVTHFHLRGSVVYFCAVKREKLLGGEQNKKSRGEKQNVYSSNL